MLGSKVAEMEPPARRSNGTGGLCQSSSSPVPPHRGQYSLPRLKDIRPQAKIVPGYPRDNALS